MRRFNLGVVLVALIALPLSIASLFTTWEALQKSVPLFFQKSVPHLRPRGGISPQRLENWIAKNGPE